MLQLSDRQSVTMQVPKRSVPLHHYLRQPRRLVNALMNPNQVEELGQGSFRLRLRVIRFLMLNVHPVVDLHISVSQERVLKVQSIGCKIQGNEFIDQRFDLTLSGLLKLDEEEEATQVTGYANLEIAVDLPPVLQLTPQSILETTGNRILRSVLSTMKQRLIRQLATDYERWSARQSPQEESDLPMGSGTAPQASCLDV